jgi:NAD(P)-dependent dehydrogenase (short-subunit alcohol dehydrogenase family)
MKRALEGRRAVVTGGGTGIGAGIATALAGAGARIAVAGRREAPLRETQARIAAAGGHCAVEALDVTDRDAVAGAFDRIARQLGGIDILVNNAGIGGPNACTPPAGGEEPPDRWSEILATNLDGVFFCTRAALRRIGEGGRILNISSVLGRFGVPGYTAYCASKHGVIGFTKALALELAGRQITANAICPGWVETDMARAGFDGLARQAGIHVEEARRIALSEVPIGRILTPGEIGELAVYLCSPAASGITGQAISICGGQTMW